MNIVYRLKTKIRNFFYPLIEDEESNFLNFELDKRIMEIQSNNYRAIVVEKLVPYYKEVYNLTDSEAWGASQALFLQGKESGKIDCLNSLNLEWKGNENE